MNDYQYENGVKLVCRCGGWVLPETVRLDEKFEGRSVYVGTCSKGHVNSWL